MQASSIILNHCDILVVAGHANASLANGGTRWMEERAYLLDIPVIRIPIDYPINAMMNYCDDGLMKNRRVFDNGYALDPDVFAVALERRLFGPKLNSQQLISGEFEKRMLAQLDPKFNEEIWEKRWCSEGSMDREVDLIGVERQIGVVLKAPQVWADHHASAMAVLVRGSFIFASTLGVVAIIGALLGRVDEKFELVGQTLEVAALAAIFWFMYRAKKYRWRSHWLSFRQLERAIDQAVWLCLLGRSQIYSTPAHVSRFQSDDLSHWTHLYFRSLLRFVSFPTIRIDQSYLKKVRTMMVDNLIAAQMKYYDEEIELHEKSDRKIENCMRGAVVIAFAANVFSILLMTFQKWCPQCGLDVYFPSPAFLTVATLGGAILTAIATALSAIRSGGEYAQIAARYAGTVDSLAAAECSMKKVVTGGISESETDILRSRVLSSKILDVTNLLMQEVQGWRAILHNKTIEPT